MPDGLRTSTDPTDDRNDTDLTDVKTPQPLSSVLSTANATVDATTTTAPYLTRFLVNPSRLSDASTVNMLLHAIAEGMAPSITVTIHSVQTMMLDSGAQISVLLSDIAVDFDPPDGSVEEQAELIRPLATTRWLPKVRTSLVTLGSEMGGSKSTAMSLGSTLIWAPLSSIARSHLPGTPVVWFPYPPSVLLHRCPHSSDWWIRFDASS